MVLLTNLVGFYMGSQGKLSYWLMLHTLLGTALVASGGAALNQLIERKQDALMRRTRSRPLPSGELRPLTVLLTGLVCAAGGVAWLGFNVNSLTSGIALVTLLSYLLIYTPLKRVTWMNTMAGAIPGALPPLIGWTGARGELGTEGIALFLIQAFWQMPHFMAIAWIYRDEYARAGFQMLPVIDPAGRRTARHALVFALLLLAASLWPFIQRQTGPFYLGGALGVGLLFAWFSGQFLRQVAVPQARRLFYLSLIYLPVLLGLMVLDKVR
jgi:protoheme IX farnesyltransferase